MGLKDLKIIHISSQSNHFLRIKDELKQELEVNIKASEIVFVDEYV